MAEEMKDIITQAVLDQQKENDEMIAIINGLVERYDTLFDAIKHGDEKHQIWLKAAIEAHFQHKPIPALP